MNCWAILALEPGAERSDIKRAYARKLKTTKPDVDPEGFKQLHAAYKLALSSAGVPAKSAARSVSPMETTQPRDGERLDARWGPEITRAEVTAAEADVPGEAFQPGETAPVEIRGQGDGDELSSLVPSPIDNLAQLERQLVDRVEDTLRDCNRAVDAASWTFLDECEELQDIQLRSEFSLYLFGRLLEHPELLKGGAGAVDYLNGFFGWTDAVDVLSDAYGPEATTWLHPVDARLAPKPSRWICPRIHAGPLEWGGYYRRIGATLLDLLMVAGVVTAGSLVVSLLGDGVALDPILVLLLVIPAYMLYAASFEASPLQGTVGKVLLGLKVTTAKGKRANILLTLWRMLMFSASTAAIKVTVWINFFINDGRLLHDRLSGTVVIKRR